MKTQKVNHSITRKGCIKGITNLEKKGITKSRMSVLSKCSPGTVTQISDEKYRATDNLVNKFATNLCLGLNISIQDFISGKYEVDSKYAKKSNNARGVEVKLSTLELEKIRKISEILGKEVDFKLIKFLQPYF